MIKKAQVTLFVIIGIVLVAGILAYFLLADVFVDTVPIELRPAYDFYVSCLEDTAKGGVRLLGEQAGFITLPEFEPGSAYMPFSSQLNFFGQPVPYWMYVSGNNILREQVPTLSGMERDLGEYISTRINDCNFDEYELRGYDIYVDEGSASAKINELDVEVIVENTITIFKGNVSVVINTHDFVLRSKLGKFYGLAREVYEYEKSSVFLEKYAIDVMRLYAPVDGIEIGCSPKVFIDADIRADIVDGLAANIPSLKLEGSYYELSSKERDYFVVDAGLNIDEDVNFMYSPSWPTRIEIYGDKVVEPVGLQEGLSAMGFCYTPYHLIYDIDFPVMIQFYDTEEIFQFPVGVVIDKSQAREAIPTTGGVNIESEVCSFRSQEVEVRTSDSLLNGVEADISFDCLDSVCQIGRTKDIGEYGVLIDNMPQCVNGYVVAKAEGYADSRYLISTNVEDYVEITLRKKYELILNLGRVERAFVNFRSEDYTTTAIYPEMDSIELVEGYYNVSVTVYDDSSLFFPEINTRRCVDAPKEGVLGFFGGQTEQCFDIKIPSTQVESAVVGGGKTQEFITESQLREAGEISINIPLFNLPETLEDLQKNQIAAEDETIYIEFA